MVWLDVSYVIQGERQAIRRDPAAYGAGGVLPRVHGKATTARYPLLRYEWRRTREALVALASTTARDTPVEVAYVNPETGGAALETIAFGAWMVRPGETVTLRRLSAARVFHAVEGRGEARIGDSTVAFDTADTFCVPGLAPVSITNNASTAPLFLVSADESPVHRKLGVLETREA